MNTAAHSIKAQRKRVGLTQGELASAVGMSTSTICHIEQGKRTIRPHELALLARALANGPDTDVPLDEFDLQNDCSMLPFNRPRVYEAWQALERKYAELGDCMQVLYRALNEKPSKSIYVVQRGIEGPIKIGLSADPSARIKSLQTGVAEELHVLAILDGNSMDERRLHQRFAEYRLNGEWFTPSQAILDWIKSMNGVMDVCPIDGDQLPIFSAYP